MTVWIVTQWKRPNRPTFVGAFSSEEKAKAAFPANDWQIVAGVLWSKTQKASIEDWEVDNTEHLA